LPRHVAFLRAINVGGHTVKMDVLSGLFRELDLTGVETFIASGNVIFDSVATDEGILSGRIERHLRKALGYEVTTFLRPVREVVAVAAYDPFPGEPLPPEGAMNIGFIANAIAAAALEALETDIDRFHVHGRESIGGACCDRANRKSPARQSRRRSAPAQRCGGSIPFSDWRRNTEPHLPETLGDVVAAFHNITRHAQDLALVGRRRQRAMFGQRPIVEQPAPTEMGATTIGCRPGSLVLFRSRVDHFEQDLVR
jgi:uncharacterized protein (DUF1697 family)